MLQGMAGRANFRIDLKTALKLLPVELAKRPVGRQRQMLGCSWNVASTVLAGGSLI
jgi:hypothetical protein